MAREARIKGDGLWYHLRGRVACRNGHYPLSRDIEAQMLLDLIKQYTSAYFCEVAGFSIMGNHYHLIVKFEEKRPVTFQELFQRASCLYPKRYLDDLAKEPPKFWNRLSERLFDVSEYMRNINQSFAEWYNLVHRRRGHFWAERFKSSIIDSPSYLGAAILYTELNGVRAKIAKKPENHRFCSAYFRHMKNDSWMMPLEELFGWVMDSESAYQIYRRALYIAGTKEKPGQGSILQSLLDQEIARNFAPTPGIYLRRCRHFIDGLVIGTKLSVLTWLAKLKDTGRFTRRRNAFESLEGGFTLRNCGKS